MEALNRESVDCKRVADLDEALAHGAGAFWYVVGGIMVLIPGHTWAAAGHVDEEPDEYLPVRLPFDKWAWDGNFDTPTLSPSIKVGGVLGTQEIWHGFMRAGRLESC